MQDWDEVEREGTGKRARVQLRSLCFGGGDAGAGAAPGAAPTAFIEFCNASGIPVR